MLLIMKFLFQSYFYIQFNDIELNNIAIFMIPKLDSTLFINLFEEYNNFNLI
jgi:hypothetical protein